MAKMCFSLMCALLVGVYMGTTPVECSLENKFEMPASCAGQMYCFDKGSNYPDEKIEELLSDMRDLKVEIPEEPPSIGSRNGGTFDEPDCPSNSTENPIFYITDNNDKVRVVVQSPKQFLQIYSVKWCLNEGLITKDTPHFLLATTLRKFKIECVSTRMNFDFFVLSDNVDPVSHKPKMEIARAKGGIPVCCRCRYDAED